MTREEHNEKSRGIILNAAIKEYGTKAYAEASINEICKEDGVSKGIVYHYYKNVDNLYLACVKKCFDDFSEYIIEHMNCQEDVFASVEQYIKNRQDFFGKYPLHFHIIYSALFQVPKSMYAQVKKSRERMEKINSRLIESLIDTYELRDGITKERAVDFVKTYMEASINYAHNEVNENEDWAEVMRVCEEKVVSSLSIILFGLVKENKRENIL